MAGRTYIERRPTLRYFSLWAIQGTFKSADQLAVVGCRDRNMLPLLFSRLAPVFHCGAERMTDISRGQRASPDGAKEKRQIREAFSNLVVEIGNWHATAARLVTVRDRGTIDVSEDIARLQSDIEDGQRRFEVAVQTLSERARVHSRVTDIRRSMDQILMLLSQR